MLHQENDELVVELGVKVGEVVEEEHVFFCLEVFERVIDEKRIQYVKQQY
jgi:hypothetical protein